MTKSVAIVGGGITGLACAHRLGELNPSIEVKIFESEPRLGGPIETIQQDGFLLERGADSFLSEKPWALDLVRRLGIEKELVNTQEKNRKIFILKKGKLVPLPEGFYLIAPANIPSFLKSHLFSLGAKCRMLIEPFIPPKKNGQEESVADFIRRRFGREALTRVGEPMIAGIYTGDAERLSMNAVLPRFIDLEKRYGSITRGLKMKLKDRKQIDAVQGPRYGLFLSFKAGMETLVKALIARLPVESIHLAREIRSVRLDEAGRQWRLTDSGGKMEMADAVCVTTQPGLAASLLGALDSDVIEDLYNFSYESVAAVYLAYPKDSFQKPLEGFGFIAPKTEKRAMLACTFASHKFSGRASDDAELLRVFVGGAFGREIYNRQDKELLDLAREDLEGLLGIKGSPLFSALHRHPRSMVQYTLGHQKRVAQIRQKAGRFRGLHFAGAAYDGVGIPDCVKSGEAAAEAVILSLRGA
ncbi:MAG: protoporphyrinogen oxidase [Candidatus Omnitrophica bacterium]|nr:protoporphyrinogen oxidase [Candidatus Omnitrophota bacterium]